MQEYIEFNYYNNFNYAKLEIDRIIDLFYDSNIVSFIEFSKTLYNWKEYILNSFTYINDDKRNKKRRLSDGPIEGINNNLEKIHINGNGFNQFSTFKKLSFFKINKYLPYKIK